MILGLVVHVVVVVVSLLINASVIDALVYRRRIYLPDEIIMGRNPFNLR